jgi:DNA excision repair protein ERCC-2
VIKYKQAVSISGKCIGTQTLLDVMVFLSCRYSRHDKRSKLPGWILSHLHDAHLNLSTDMALHIAREVSFTTLFSLTPLLSLNYFQLL